MLKEWDWARVGGYQIPENSDKGPWLQEGVAVWPFDSGAVAMRSELRMGAISTGIGAGLPHRLHQPLTCPAFLNRTARASGLGSVPGALHLVLCLVAVLPLLNVGGEHWRCLQVAVVSSLRPAVP